MHRILLLTLALLLGADPSAASEVRLKGSALAMVQQNRVAREHGLSFLLTPAQVRRSLADGDLVALDGNEDYEVAKFVSYPYVVPPVRKFVERLSADYRAACGQKLVVTSAVRPVSAQPRNAHQLSVHPAGMAVDVRVSDRPSCRQWMEAELVTLGKLGVLNGIRERTPPHYHVAVYPMPYLAYVEEQEAEARATLAARLLKQMPAAAQELRETAEATASAPVTAEQPEAGRRGLLPLAVTSLTALFGGWIVMGVRLPSASAVGPRIRRLSYALRRRAAEAVSD